MSESEKADDREKDGRRQLTAEEIDVLDFRRRFRCENMS